MTVIERIKETCRSKKNISITTLEQELGYSNGSLSKAKDIPSSRIMEIAIYLGVSMDYLMTGKQLILNQETSDLAVKFAIQDGKTKEYMIKFAELSDSDKDMLCGLIDRLLNN